MRNKDKKKEYDKKYRQDHAEDLKEYRQNNREKLKENAKQYRQENKNKIKEYNTQYEKTRRQTEPSYKLRKQVSNSIWKMLKKNNSSKQGKSIIDHLTYTIKELKDHIEKQFSLLGNEWMNWNNHGIYNSKTWNDLDPATWTWNIDHIKPHSNFPYTSMKDDNFKECWSLSNLRPYSAKKNVIEGNRKASDNG